VLFCCIVYCSGSCILDLNEEGYDNIVKAIVARLVQDGQVDDGTSGLIAQVLHGRHKHQHATTFWDDVKGAGNLCECSIIILHNQVI